RLRFAHIFQDRRLPFLFLFGTERHVHRTVTPNGGDDKLRQFVRSEGYVFSLCLPTFYMRKNGILALVLGIFEVTGVDRVAGPFLLVGVGRFLLLSTTDFVLGFGLRFFYPLVVFDLSVQ